MAKTHQGIYTAIITPFKQDHSIDWDALKSLVEFQIEGGVTGIVACGTTGEAPTLSHPELAEVIERVVEWVNKRCAVLAGTGSNCTDEAIRMSRHAEEIGADGCLVVSPYYNKPSQEGLYRHFKAISEAVGIPIMLYNIKGRTGVNIGTPTLLRLAEECDNIVSVKEASGDLDQIKEVVSKTPEDFSVVSGDDVLTYECIRSGADGVVSVAANLVPDQIVKLVELLHKEEFSEAERLNERLTPLFRGVFLETNPVPIKAALAMKGLCQEIYRLPLCELSADNREKWERTLKELGII